MDEQLRRRDWPLYGRFTALMFCSSCVGAVTWTAWLQVLVNLFIGNNDTTISTSQQNLLFAVARRWRVAYSIAYPIEFLCMTVAKLMVLDRMFQFAAPPTGAVSKHWALGARVVMALVVVINLVGLAGNIAGAVVYARAADNYEMAAISFAANNTDVGSSKYNVANDEVQLANFIVSVQSLCEVAVLLLIVAAFAIVALACMRRISTISSVLTGGGSSEQANALATGNSLRQRIVCTTAFVFVTFLLRSMCTPPPPVRPQQQHLFAPTTAPLFPFDSLLQILHHVRRRVPAARFRHALPRQR
jgi:hypothetical protein